MAEGAAPFWRMKGVSKRYGGVRALAEVDFECAPGRIHAILGENGAGKSTLIKIIAGVVQPDEGQMEFLGQPASFKSPAEATKAGIVCVFQELSLMPDLSVADNICITDPPRWSWWSGVLMVQPRADAKSNINCVRRCDSAAIAPTPTASRISRPGMAE